MNPFFSTHPLPTFTSPLEVLRLQPQAFFFHTSTEPDQNGNFEPQLTIVGFDSFEKLEFSNAKVKITNEEGIKEIAISNPFSALQDRIIFHQSKIQENIFCTPQFSCPFKGGALGYFTFETIRYLEPTALSTRTLNSNNSSTSDGEFNFYKSYIVYDHTKKLGHFLSDSLESISKLQKQFLNKTDDPFNSFKTKRTATELSEVPEINTSQMVSMFSKNEFENSVKYLKENIRSGEIFQAVISEKFTTPFLGNPLQLFETLISLSPSPYQFYFSTVSAHDSSKFNVYLGASPETLLKINGEELETHPIAGTRPRGKNAEEEKRLEAQLLASPKEKAEHLMLVDLSRNDLGRVSEPGTVTVESYMKIKKFSGVMHLVSVVKGKILKGVTSLQALASCFPAGTLSGAPKIRAMQLISSQEPEPRGFYGGAVVVAEYFGNLDSCISIRSIQIKNKTAIIQAGAGIVIDSDPTREYQEVEHKTRRLRQALAVEKKKYDSHN